MQGYFKYQAKHEPRDFKSCMESAILKRKTRAKNLQEMTVTIRGKEKEEEIGLLKRLTEYNSWPKTEPLKRI